MTVLSAEENCYVVSHHTPVERQRSPAVSRISNRNTLVIDLGVFVVRISDGSSHDEQLHFLRTSLTSDERPQNALIITGTINSDGRRGMDNSCTKHGLRLIGLKTVSNQTRTSYAREDSIQYSEPAAVNADSHDDSVRTPRSLTTGFARESTAYDELYDAVEFRFDDISLAPERLLSVPRVMSGTSPRLLINHTPVGTRVRFTREWGWVKH